MAKKIKNIKESILFECFLDKRQEDTMFLTTKKV